MYSENYFLPCLLTYFKVAHFLNINVFKNEVRNLFLEWMVLFLKCFSSKIEMLDYSYTILQRHPLIKYLLRPIRNHNSPTSRIFSKRINFMYSIQPSILQFIFKDAILIVFLLFFLLFIVNDIILYFFVKLIFIKTFFNCITF